jgi:hypothetical protein
MSDQFQSALVRQYHANIEMLLQQRGGVLQPYVRMETQKSERQFYEQVGSVVAEQVTTRFAESPIVNTPHDRRMVTITPYHVGDFIDTFEQVQALIDPSSSYVQNFVRALGREKDRVIYQSMFGDASTGKEGTTTEAFSTTASTSGGQVITVDFGVGNSGLTLAKLIEARRVMLAAFNDPGDEGWSIIVNSAGLSDLLNTTQVQSIDYNTVRALVAGQIDSFLGFKFVNWEGYVLSGTNVMQGVSGVASEVVFNYPVFVKSGVLCAVGKEITTEVTRRADRSFHWYAYACAQFGATRMQPRKVAKIERYISG